MKLCTASSCRSAIQAFKIHPRKAGCATQQPFDSFLSTGTQWLIGTSTKRCVCLRDRLLPKTNSQISGSNPREEGCGMLTCIKPICETWYPHPKDTRTAAQYEHFNCSIHPPSGASVLHLLLGLLVD